MKITRELLKKKRACISSRKEFDRVFPNGMRLTRKNLMKAVLESGKHVKGISSGDLLLDIIWLFQKILPLIYNEHRHYFFDLESSISNKTVSERRAQYRVAKMLADELKLK